jgi:hypothetical protein
MDIVRTLSHREDSASLDVPEAGTHQLLDGHGPLGFAQNQARERLLRSRQLDALRDEWEFYYKKNAAYHDAITRLIRFVVPEGANVLQVGCATGDLLAELRPGTGVGVEMSPRMVARAKEKYPQLDFVLCDPEQLDAPELRGRTFDFIVVSDMLGTMDDIWAAFRAIHQVCHSETRVIITYYNFLWEPVLSAATKLGFRAPIPDQNWLGMADIENLIELSGFDLIRRGTAQLLPMSLGPLSRLANRYLASAPILEHLALTQFFVCRPLPIAAKSPSESLSCSVIVPCKNEFGNVDDIVARTPEMGRGTELIFVDGNSTDGTVAAIERHIAAGTRPNMRLIHQGSGKGKGDAVRKGFAAATGDVLFILDADLTVPPEDLPRFYAAIAEGKAEFVNGSRLVYPMEGEAMRFLNSLGNKFFGLALSAVLEQRLKDTLCGTKVLRRRDYEKIAANRSFFGDFDPFGDFDLLFGAAKQNLKILEMPIRYRARTYGETKISRFRDGATLLRMTAHAFRKFRLAY